MRWCWRGSELGARSQELGATREAGIVIRSNSKRRSRDPPAPTSQLPAMSAFTTQHENGIAVITFDLPGELVNKLTAAVRVEIEALLIRLRDDTSTRGFVLISGKPDSFIAGADIEEFTALTSQD